MDPIFEPFRSFLLPLLLLLLSLADTTGAPQQEFCTASEQTGEESSLASVVEEIKEQLVASGEALEALEKRLERQEKIVRELTEALDLASLSGSQGRQAGKGARVKSVKADADVTYICPVHRAADGLSRYVAIGDSIGNLYIFSMKGDLLAEHPTGTTSPITSMTTHFLDRNHTALLTGHMDGSVRKHIVLDKVIRAYPGGRPESSVEGISLNNTLLPQEESEPEGGSQLAVLPESITHLFTSRISGQHVVFFADQKGLFGSMWANGSVITSEKLDLEFKSFRVERHQIAAFHEKGLSVFSSPSGRFLHNMNCLGLNGSTIQSAAFDPAAITRAYAATKDGELLAFIIEKNFMTCRVHHRQEIRLPPGPVNVGILKGYIVLSSSLGIIAYNTTVSMRTGPREVVLEPHSNIAAAFGQEVESVEVPLIASSGNSLLVLSLGGNGLTAMFQSNLPTQKPVEFNPKLWQQPIFIGAMVLVGFWQFLKYRSPQPPPSFSGYPPKFRPVR